MASITKNDCITEGWVIITAMNWKPRTLSPLPELNTVFGGKTFKNQAKTMQDCV